MRKPDITTLPPLVLAEDEQIICHKEGCGMEETWEEIIESAFGKHYNFDFLIKAGDYSPEHVLYLTVNGKPIATTSAVASPTFEGEGWYRMVGVHADAKGRGAGKKIALAALYAPRERGYTSAMLSTDDERIPALSLYLSLGFEPYYCHESHKERWEKVFEEIAKVKRK
jgi:mycothiol synthase